LLSAKYSDYRQEKIMKTLAAVALGLSFAATLPAQHAPIPITVSIDTQKTMPPVSKYLYGMFTEHIRNTFYRAVWAEMIDDRKFYSPITSATAPGSRGQQGGGGRGAAAQSWRPIGPDNVVTMDKQDAYSGEQSPRIALDASTPHGIRQGEIARRVIGHERQAADAHDVVGGDRGQHIRAVYVGERRNGDGVCGMQVDDGGCLRAFVVHRAVEEGLLGRRIAGDELAVGVELGEPRRIKPAE